ncbi:hypothetical protein GCM10023074_32870 [Microbispora amethystogenes]|uniref:Uncharacterized protein n=1 Tax=Microbispora amethystogenes TaxID=1427754 RepID=A0ABQ4FFN1_9ACTN|nr:hypothetical protein Mam01_37280 [Microbispora amethystogenes]
MRSPYQTIQPGVFAARVRAAPLPAVISFVMPILPLAVSPGAPRLREPPLYPATREPSTIVRGVTPGTRLPVVIR